MGERSERFYDDEFDPDLLKVLRKRDILGEANPAQLAPLVYNLLTEVRLLEKKFQTERQQNPLLETTPPEAWIAAELLPWIQQVRCGVDLDERILSAVLKRKLRCAVQPLGESCDQHLHRAIQPYLTHVKKLLLQIVDRRKSLGQIMSLRPNAYSVRDALKVRQPNTRREATIVRSIREGRPDHWIARELDKHGDKPKGDFASYTEMLRISPQLFYSMKSNIKKKYLRP